ELRDRYGGGGRRSARCGRGALRRRLVRLRLCRRSLHDWRGKHRRREHRKQGLPREFHPRFVLIVVMVDPPERATTSAVPALKRSEASPAWYTPRSTSSVSRAESGH